MTASKSEIQRTIGCNIRKYRTERSYTLAKLAEMAELSEGHIIQIEGGFKSLSVPSLCRVAEALQVSMDCLVYGESRTATFGNIDALLSSVSDDELKKIEELLCFIVNKFCLKD